MLQVEEVTTTDIPEQLDGYGLLRAPDAALLAAYPLRPLPPTPEREQAKARLIQQAEADDAVLRQEDEKLNRIMQKHLMEGLFTPGLTVLLYECSLT